MKKLFIRKSQVGIKYCLPAGVISIFDGLVTILTLGNFGTDLPLRFAMWKAFRNYKHKK